jgi:hypothetical protein
MFTYVLLVIALIILFSWNPVFEHMTNADVEKKIAFGASNPTSWDTTPKSTSKKVSDMGEIYGPKAPPIGKDEPKPVPSKSSKKGTEYVYPTVLGPEQLKVPGKRVPESTPDLTPTSEFPAGPAEPQPFLTDFSRILNAN